MYENNKDLHIFVCLIEHIYGSLCIYRSIGKLSQNNQNLAKI